MMLVFAASNPAYMFPLSFPPCQSFFGSLANQIDTSRMKAPAFKMILTATGEYAYRRPDDGIYIVPIGCLKQ